MNAFKLPLDDSSLKIDCTVSRLQFACLTFFAIDVLQPTQWYMCSPVCISKCLIQSNLFIVLSSSQYYSKNRLLTSYFIPRQQQRYQHIYGLANVWTTPINTTATDDTKLLCLHSLVVNMQNGIEFIVLHAF